MTPSEALATTVVYQLNMLGTTPLNKAQVDFLGCLISAIMEAVPCFLTSFMACLAGGGAAGYTPGDRPRCG